MREKARTYINQSLSASGFAVLDSGTAYRLMPDLWTTRQAAGFDFSIDPTALRVLADARGAEVYVCNAAGFDRALLIVAMTDDELELRVKRITGLRIADLQLAKPQPKAPKVASAPTVPSADEPPTKHPSVARARWFEAHGLKDPLLERPAEARNTAMDQGNFAGRESTKPRF